MEFCNHLRFCIIWVLGFARGCITQGPLAFNAWDIKMSFACIKGSRKKIHMKCYICETNHHVCQYHKFTSKCIHCTSNGFRCVCVFHIFLKIYEDLWYETKLFMLIINMWILNNSDHELGAHKRAKNKTYTIGYVMSFFTNFSKFIKI